MFNNPLLDHYQHLLNNLLIYTDDNAQCYTKKKAAMSRFQPSLRIVA